jgi:hypothetical protein
MVVLGGRTTDDGNNDGMEIEEQLFFLYRNNKNRIP